MLWILIIFSSWPESVSFRVGRSLGKGCPVRDIRVKVFPSLGQHGPLTLCRGALYYTLTAFVVPLRTYNPVPPPPLSMQEKTLTQEGGRNERHCHFKYFPVLDERRLQDVGNLV